MVNSSYIVFVYSRVMVILVIVSVCLSIFKATAAENSLDLCLNPDCICQDEKLICICKERTDLNIIKIENDKIAHVEIRNCRKVTLWFGCFKKRNLKALLFSNLDGLIVQSLALVDITYLGSLIFEDIANFEARKFAIYIFDRTEKVIFRNVTLTSFPADFLSITDLKELQLVDSNIRIIESKSFHGVNLEKFILSGNRINTIESYAFKIDKHKPVDEILFFNNRVEYAESNALVCTEEVSKIFIYNCTFRELHSKFLRSTSKSFAFEDNVIEFCESNVFSYVSVSEKVVFARNFFEKTEPNCLPSKFEDKNQFALTVTVLDNEFACDCHLSWIWHPSFKIFYESGKCIDTSTNMTNLLPKLNEFGVCVELVNKTINDHSDGLNQLPNSIPHYWIIIIIFICVIVLIITVVVFSRKYKCHLVFRKSTVVHFGDDLFRTF